MNLEDAESSDSPGIPKIGAWERFPVIADYKP